MFSKAGPIRDSLIGRPVILNDDQGDGYAGYVEAVDDTGWRLRGSGPNPVILHQVDKPGTKLEMASVFIPADRVKFVTEGGPTAVESG